MWFLLVLLVIVLIIAFTSIKIVKQSEVYIIERLGKFHKVADAGLTIIVPFFDHVRSVVSLKQQTMDIPPQGVITKDNVTISIDTVVFYKITDPAKAVYEIQSLRKGIEYEKILPAIPMPLYSLIVPVPVSYAVGIFLKDPIPFKVNETSLSLSKAPNENLGQYPRLFSIERISSFLNCIS